MSRELAIVDDIDLAGLIDRELQYSIGGSGSNNQGADDSEITEAWTNSLDYYFGKPRGDEVEGRSKVISMDLADMVEQTVAQIMPSFATDCLGEFEAYSVEESNQAKIESDAVNWTILNQNNGFIEFTGAIKDGLLQRNGIIEIYVDEHFEIEENSYENVGLMPAQQILQDPNNEITAAEDIQDAIFDTDNNLIQEPLYNLQVKTKIPVKQLKIESVAPDNFAVNQDHNSIYLHDARFVCHTVYKTRSQLIQMGYDQETVNGLKATTHKTDEESRARSRSESENDMDSAQFQGEIIEVQKVFYLVDTDGDGVAERRRIIKAGSEILENEIFPTVPYAAGTSFLLPHRFWCLSMYDKLKQVQDTKTSFLRKTLDNAEGLINQRVIAVNGQVNMDDLLSSRPTGVVRAKRNDAVVPYPVQNLGDTGFKMLGYMDKVRKEGGGAQLDVGTSENMPVQGQTAHGMERWMSSQEQLSYMMTRTNAETLVKETYRITHLLMRTFMPEQMMYKSGNQMVSTVPGMWPPRAKVSINIQLSMAEKQRKYQVLENVIAQQKEAMQNGYRGVLASEETIFNAKVDQLKLAGLDNPERYWINPNSPQAQQAAQQNAQGMQAQQQQEIAQNDKLLQTQLQITNMQEQSDKLKAQLDYAIKTNEQLRKWVDMELEYSTDIPGQGQEGGTVQ